MKKNRTLLIDGDVLLYRFGFANEKSVTWEEGVESEWEDPDLAIADMKGFIWSLQGRTLCAVNPPIVCLSGPATTMFRYKLLPSYKHNRQGKEKPKLYHMLKEYLLENYKISRKENLEADDCLGILSTKKPGRYVVATIDKDLTQVPGWFFNWNKDTAPRWIDESEADQQFYRQCLSGDPVDGFSGVPGIGGKRADKLIAPLFDGTLDGPPVEEVWQVILEQYEKKGLDEAYALTMARMARILRSEDWDSEAQEPIMWTPFNPDVTS